MLQKWFLHHWKLISGLVIVSVIATPIALNLYVNNITKNSRYTEAVKIPPQPVAIVFGAGVYSDGTPSPMLADRVTAAVELYKLGRVKKILMTGDNSRENYDEVTTMQKFAVARGVPEKDITLDYAGFSTYESCYRAKKIFGVKNAVLVTQNFHLPRAVYTCRQFDIQALGLGTPDWESYSKLTVSWYTFREQISIIKALWEVHVTHPKPTFLGEFEGIK
jgi:vancomycin permeability regulator SanA